MLSSCVMVLDLDGSGAMNSVTTLDFHLFPALRSVTIGDHSFRNVKHLSFSSLRCLETITIGSNCFTNDGGHDLLCRGSGDVPMWVRRTAVGGDWELQFFRVFGADDSGRSLSGVAALRFVHVLQLSGVCPEW